MLSFLLFSPSCSVVVPFYEYTMLLVVLHLATWFSTAFKLSKDLQQLGLKQQWSLSKNAVWK